LIGADVPPTLIAGYVVYNDKAQQHLIDLGIASQKVAIRPKYYF